jgi:hypothetical protein
LRDTAARAASCVASGSGLQPAAFKYATSGGMSKSSRCEESIKRS